MREPTVQPGRWGATPPVSLFAVGRREQHGADLPAWRGEEVAPRIPPQRLRAEAPAIPVLSEPEGMRHFTRLSLLNHHIERGMYPLGSCTMKYNPRLDEKVAALPGFAGLHPAQDPDDLQGLLCALKLLEDALCRITGFAACSLQPAAGAHGELLGMKIIRAFHVSRGEPQRTRVLIPDSAHGTNPASVVIAGLQPVTIPSGPDGRLDPEAVAAAVGPETAGMMITNPNTLGLFETRITEVAEIVHAAGGRLYMDGANMNAILGKALPARMGFDVVHLNLHKTFATPHGGGGPGAGPICVTEELASFLPAPTIVERDGRFDLEWHEGERRPQLHGWFGNVGVCLRALAYILRLGADGLPRVAERAVLNANYLRHLVEPLLPVPRGDRTLHEFVASGESWKQEFGVRTLDIAKRLLDYGFHAPTIYFPLIVNEALMIEPTETESRAVLDAFAAALRAIHEEAGRDPDLLHGAPHTTPVGRLDEARAARQPDLAWPAEARE